MLAGRLGLAAAPGLQEVLSGTACWSRSSKRRFRNAFTFARLRSDWAVSIAQRQRPRPGSPAGCANATDLVLLDGAAGNNGAVADVAAEVDAVYLVLDDGQVGQPIVKTATRDLARMGAAGRVDRDPVSRCRLFRTSSQGQPGSVPAGPAVAEFNDTKRCSLGISGATTPSFPKIKMPFADRDYPRVSSVGQ